MPRLRVRTPGPSVTSGTSPNGSEVPGEARHAQRTNRPKSRPGFTAYVALCAFAGLRRGEALGVQVGDIDFLARTLRVTRQIQRAKAADIKAGKNLVEAVAGITVLIRPPKYESERTIYLPDELVAILAEHIRQHTPSGEPTRWLFDDGGKPWHDKLVDYRWRSTRTDAGLTYKLHELRHYFASGLIAAGCDVVTVQRAMGHASATTTLSTYAHLWPSAEDRPARPRPAWRQPYSHRRRPRPVGLPPSPDDAQLRFRPWRRESRACLK
ncbi:MAG: site-specific integrase [Jiangellaceae bacterium]